MKKFFVFLLFCLNIMIFAALPPESVMLESGNVRVRLDGRKRWNMNRIEYQGQLLCVDNSHSHYGMTCRPHNFKFGVGSGHDESGFVEEALSVKIYTDGKEVIPQKNVAVKGSKIKVVKNSKILDIDVIYTIVIENDIITEFIDAVASKDMKLHHLYFFMHPWSPRFSDLHIMFDNGTTADVSFKSDNKFVNRKFAPYSAWYDKKSGYGVVTSFKNLKGGKKLMRLIWDRPQYRKDYLCDYFNDRLPAGHKISYQSKTVFFRQQDKTKWISAAEDIYKQIKL